MDNMEAVLSLLIIEFSAPLWSLQIGFGWQPITAKITASSEDGLLIGQFLVCPAMSQPISRD